MPLQYISGWLFESNGEIGIRSIDAKITQTINPIVNMTKTIELWLMLPYSSQTTILKCTV